MPLILLLGNSRNSRSNFKHHFEISVNCVDLKHVSAYSSSHMNSENIYFDLLPICLSWVICFITFFKYSSHNKMLKAEYIYDCISMLCFIAITTRQNTLNFQCQWNSIGTKRFSSGCFCNTSNPFSFLCSGKNSKGGCNNPLPG